MLKQFKGYHNEKLSGEWSGFDSCRLNKKWRVIHCLSKTGSVKIEALELVEVCKITPHDYRKK